MLAMRHVLAAAGFALFAVLAPSGCGGRSEGGRAVIAPKLEKLGLEK